MMSGIATFTIVDDMIIEIMAIIVVKVTASLLIAGGAAGAAAGRLSATDTLASERPEPAVRRVDRDLDHHARTQPTVALLDRDAHLDTLRHLGEGAGFVQPRQQRELAVGGMADPVDPALEDLARIGVDKIGRAHV